MSDTLNKSVLVTGATSGLGLALVRCLRDAGYHPIASARDAEKVSALAAAEGVAGYLLDVADHASISNVIDRIESDHGPLWGLVNNAGIWLEGDFADYTPDQIKAVLDTNMTGTIMMSHAVLPGMISRGRGTILNVVSTGALYTRKLISIYSASKWAIRGFTGCLEAECAPQGVRVMGFYPGKINSAMYETAGVERDLEVSMTPQQAALMVRTMLDDETMVWSQVGGRSILDYT